MITRNYVVGNRTYGYLYRGGFDRDITRATIFSTPKAARDAARAAAKLYGVTMEVRPTSRPSRRDREADQSARTTQNRPAIDAFLARSQSLGLLTICEPHGRKYSY